MMEAKRASPRAAVAPRGSPITPLGPKSSASQPNLAGPPNRTYWLAVSHAGTLLSAILRVTKARWQLSITRMAELITVVALLVGALFPFIDLGRPERVLNLIWFGRWQSPLLWDILAITTLKRQDPLTGQERPDVVAGIIAEDVQILAVSQTLIKSTPKTDGAAVKAGSSATPGAAGTATAGAEARDLDTGSTFEKAVSITLALPVDKAAKVALIDALEDNLGQYRILPRRAGNDELLSGTKIWSFDDIFPTKK